MMSKQEPILISVGGSIIVPDEIDANLITEFKKTILRKVDEGFRFILTLGGGKTCRKYQAAAKFAEPDITNNELDWIGIHSTRFNAEFMRIIFGEHANSEIILDPMQKQEFTKSVIFAGGYRPTASTDHSSVLIARTYGIKSMINLTNIDYVFDSDPKNNPNAKKIEQITWSEYRKIIPANWSPGANAPFDPVASKEAEELGMIVAILNGRRMENLSNYLDGKPFIGTVIK